MSDNLFYAAADIVSERGLAKYFYEDSKGSVCFLGALLIAANNGEFFYTSHVWQKTQSYRSFALDQLGMSITEWNDQISIGKEDVVLKLKEIGKAWDDENSSRH